MTAFWQFFEPARYGLYPEDPGFLEVTGFGDPVWSFLPGPRDPAPAELAELRAKFLAESQRGLFGAVILPPEPHGIVHRPREQSRAEFRRAWFAAADEQDARIVACVLGTPVTGAREPPRAEEPRRGQCQSCGTDDEVDIWSRCPYCAELAALKARNLPGPRLNGWWFTVPAALALALLTALCYAVMSVILAG